MKKNNSLKMILASAFIAAGITTTSVNAITSTYLLGDVNRNDMITNEDYEKILSYVKREDLNLDEEQLYLADINQDGDVTLIDAGLLLAAIKGKKLRFLSGDVNRDGMITLDDCNLISDYVKAEITLDEEQIWLADLNGNKDVELTDYSILLKAIKGIKPRFYMGDVNRDEKLTSDDAQLILCYYDGKVEFDDEQKYLADINGDGVANQKDAKDVLKYASGSLYRFLKGDVNRDGKITHDDEEVMYNHVNETELLEGEQFCLGDLNDDGKVNGKDLNMLYSILNGSTLRYNLGDINRDGKVDEADVELIQQAIEDNSILDDEQKHLADMNRDGNITQEDGEALSNFVNSGFTKGDLDRNTVIDANDASMALEIFKAENATVEDVAIGDMDNNGVIDANDASLILELYKTNN